MDYKIEFRTPYKLKGFFGKYHYLGDSIPKNCSFGLVLLDPNGRIVGAALVGIPAGRLASGRDTMELRRFALVPNTVPNTASFFMSHIIKQLKNVLPGRVKRLITYADQAEGHTGTMYKASNWTLIGQTKKTEVIHFKGKNYHLRTVYGGGAIQQTPNGEDLRIELKNKKAKRLYIEPRLKFEYLLAR